MDNVQMQLTIISYAFSWQLVFRTVGFSGADIRNLVNEAAIMAVRKGHSRIYQEDIVDVLDKQLLEGMGVLLTEEEQQKCEESVSFEKKRLLAVHEAGHILLSHLFPHFDWHAFSQLLPGGKETAISVFYPREDMIDQGYTTFGYMKMQMVVAHGGRCAEHLVFGDDVTDGGSDDLEKITKIAREMVISPQNARLGLTALTKRVGLRDRPDSPESGLIKYKWDDPHVIPANMTLEVSELFTRELTREVEEIMKGLSPMMFEDFVKPFQIDLKEAYRLYNPTSGKIIVSRNVVFDEFANWNWCENQKLPTAGIQIEDDISVQKEVPIDSHVITNAQSSLQLEARPRRQTQPSSRLRDFEELGMKRPTPVQAHCIPKILAGRDVLGLAQTGSGKTAAFALPILHRLAEDPYGIFALVVTPTRELAYQLAEQFRALGSCLHLRCAVVVGFLVLDEADRVLDVGFQEELRAVFHCLPKNRQTLLFSATMTSNLETLLELSANKAYFYEAYEGFKTVDTLKQQYVFIPKNVKDVYLVHILSKMEDMGIRSAMIFVSTCSWYIG
ncbi:hypothetical protein GH714_039576 [Hevea brasiliensis]|uniref:Helicase ATP-binding domain-containing protein n=1 Tax=Hevea brasiliensis TaxID=3981 RepID=A0A6A6MZ00_HEVBR|nr:hypothetical protein GH714_039576 [Hevea brasiliensis]